MLDIGWSELLVIGVVALVVVGPKELPVMFRTLGRFTAKARSMSREFTKAMEAAAKESGVGDAVKDLKSVTSARSMGLDAIENAASRFEKWDPMKKAPAVPKVVVPAVALADSGAVAATIGPGTIGSGTTGSGTTGSGTVGSATATLAAERAEKRASVITAAESRAKARTSAATASLNDPAPAAQVAKVVKPKAPRKAKPALAVVAVEPVAPPVPAPPVPARLPVAAKPKARKPKTAGVIDTAVAPVGAVAPANKVRRSRPKAGEA